MQGVSCRAFYRDNVNWHTLQGCRVRPWADNVRPYIKICKWDTPPLGVQLVLGSV